jgi:histidinol-phosphate aminotransferase
VIGPSTKMIFLCNPNNPTGTIFIKKDFEKFLNEVPEKIIIILDEAYGDYSDRPDYPRGFDYIKGKKNLIVLRTFSKIYGLAGLRVGYGAAKEDLIKYMNLAKMPFNVNKIGQLAAIAALNDDAFKNMSLENNKAGKEYLYRELDNMKLKYLKTQANFIFIEFDKNSDKIFLDLLKLGVIIRPLSSFGFPNAIRVTVGTPRQNEAFINALKKVL